MKIVISNTSDIPLYQQIKDQIKDAILKEELVEGDPLPSIRGFANDLKVSVLTIRRVYEELERGRRADGDNHRSTRNAGRTNRAGTADHTRYTEQDNRRSKDRR